MTGITYHLQSRFSSFSHARTRKPERPVFKASFIFRHINTNARWNQTSESDSMLKKGFLLDKRKKGKGKRLSTKKYKGKRGEQGEYYPALACPCIVRHLRYLNKILNIKVRIIKNLLIAAHTANYQGTSKLRYLSLPLRYLTLLT